jgi:3-deoxy-D-manno-octulosonic-acid transferase
MRMGRLAGGSLARYIDLVYRTSRVLREPEGASLDAFLRANGPAIVAVWHGQFLMAPQAKPLEVPLAIMLARHGDAELFAEALARFNTTLIRGAGANGRLKDRGGASALRGALRTLQQGIHVGMTADVPPGPARKAGMGIVTLAAMSGRPIIPLAAASSRFRVLETWSRMTVNLPFGDLACVFGDPIHVPRNADAATLEAIRQSVERGLDRATARAYRLAGADITRTYPPGTTVRHGGLEREPPSPPGFALKSYRAVTRMLRPAVPLLLGARARRGKEEPERRGERLGIAATPRPAGEIAWIHAASVGELNAVLPLAETMRAARPGLRVLFTTGTVTSARIAELRTQPSDFHQYMPLDSPKFVARFLDHWRPDAAILTESEIWPNMILACGARSIPLTLVNARMSQRSFERWKRLERIARPLFSRFDLVLAQNEEMAERFRNVGAANVFSVGNLKIDAPPPPIDEAALIRLREALGDRPCYVAASTHEGEEQIIAAAHRLVARRHERVCTIIAPRHPERGIGIAEAMKSQGLSTVLRSTGALPTDTTDIYIADTIGELGTLYALSSVAFIGGSLIARGGQNPIEAVRHGAAVISGAHWSNFSDAYDALSACGGVTRVTDAASLAEAIERLLSDPQELARSRAAGQTAFQRMSGALSRSVNEITKLLPEARELASAGS